MSSKPPDILQLKVTLRNVRPPIWRRIQVPSSFSLAALHEVLQIVMGWSNSHLHQFDVGGMCFADPRFELDTEDSSKEKLSMIVQECARFSYHYDFGDDWQHDILIEKALALAPGVDYPICIAGKRACPPEDCGGPWGYADMLAILKKSPSKRNDEDTERLDWLGHDFDPEAFDLDAIDSDLKQLRPKRRIKPTAKKATPKLVRIK